MKMKKAKKVKKTKELIGIKIKGKYYKDTFTTSIDTTKDFAYATKKELMFGSGFVELFSKDTIVAPIEEAKLFYIEHERK